MSESRTLRLAKAAKKVSDLAYASEFYRDPDPSRLPRALVQLDKAMAEWRGEGG
ncbi:hypothetical protein GCM10022600_15050 [Qipengyuania pelagi]|uniref:Uncharacterized protein n=1 Tax=Qipengyuania pelagi TaxID=994320 RepID=A0A844Y849_9SPHN|nr:hypothetical protein [Qipengyuania pelagi]MXO53639.1 hypothetical protein [Qipengyuania pelagi]